MCAATLDFDAERNFVEISPDPQEILGWMTIYREQLLAAQADSDADAAGEIDDLIDFAEDRVVALKAARPRPSPRETRHRPETVVAPKPAAAPTPEPVASPKRERAQCSGGDRTATMAAAAATQTEQDRADEQDLRQLQERAANAKARYDAALAATARIEAEAKQAAAEAGRARREQVKQHAAKVAVDTEKAATEAEAAARSAATAAASSPSRVSGEPAASTVRASVAANRPMERPAATGASDPVTGLTPLARLFREQLADLVADPADRPAAATASVPSVPPRAPTALPQRGPRQAADTPVRVAQSKPPPADVVPPPRDPIDELPPFTGLDLAKFRDWLGVSQRALATKLGVEQSSISRGEGRPTTILPAALRKALDQAMRQPRPDARGAP